MYLTRSTIDITAWVVEAKSVWKYGMISFHNGSRITLRYQMIRKAGQMQHSNTPDQPTEPSSQPEDLHSALQHAYAALERFEQLQMRRTLEEAISAWEPVLSHPHFP